MNLKTLFLGNWVCPRTFPYYISEQGSTFQRVVVFKCKKTQSVVFKNTQTKTKAKKTTEAQS